MPTNSLREELETIIDHYAMQGEEYSILVELLPFIHQKISAAFKAVELEVESCENLEEEQAWNQSGWNCAAAQQLINHASYLEKLNDKT
jgi:hypothetical protein